MGLLGLIISGRLIFHLEFGLLVVLFLLFQFHNLVLLENLYEEGASFHVAAMTDPRIMSQEERIEIFRRLLEVDEALARGLEEEIIDPYDTTLERLKHREIELEWPKGRKS